MAGIGPQETQEDQHVYRIRNRSHAPCAQPGHWKHPGTANPTDNCVRWRAGIGRFTFPAAADSNFLFDVGRNAGGASDASIEIIDNQKVAGSVSSGGFCGGPNKYTVYFVAEFNRPFTVARGYTEYANLSSWDIYRGQVQLLALLHPKETSDMIRSLLAAEREGGALPVWPVTNHDSCMMVGDPACPILAGAGADSAAFCDTGSEAALSCAGRGHSKCGFKAKRIVSEDQSG